MNPGVFHVDFESTGQEETIDLGEHVPSSTHPAITVTLLHVLEQLPNSPTLDVVYSGGGPGPSLSSFGMNLRLGFSTNGMYAGRLYVREQTPSAALTSPSSL